MINIYKFVGKKDKTYELEDVQKLNSNCPADQKSGTGPGSCGGSTGKSTKMEGPDSKNPKEPSSLSNAVTNKQISDRDLFDEPAKYDEIKAVRIPESERTKIFNKLASNTMSSTGSETGKRFESIVRGLKSYADKKGTITEKTVRDYEKGLQKLTDLVRDVSHDEANNKVRSGSTKDLITYIGAQKDKLKWMKDNAVSDIYNDD